MRFSLVDANDGGQRPDRVVAGRRWSPHEIEGAGFRPCDGESSLATSGRQSPPTPGHEPHDREIPVSPAAARASDPGESRVGFGLGGNCRRRRLVHGFRSPAIRSLLPATRFRGHMLRGHMLRGMDSRLRGNDGFVRRFPLSAPRSPLPRACRAHGRRDRRVGASLPATRFRGHMLRGHALRRHRPHENDGEWRPVHVPSFPRKRESTCSGAGPSSALPLPRS